jgi:hypothetical protein
MGSNVRYLHPFWLMAKTRPEPQHSGRSIVSDKNSGSDGQGAFQGFKSGPDEVLA